MNNSLFLEQDHLSKNYLLGNTPHTNLSEVNQHTMNNDTSNCRHSLQFSRLETPNVQHKVNPNSSTVNATVPVEEDGDISMMGDGPLLEVTLPVRYKMNNNDEGTKNFTVAVCVSNRTAMHSGNDNSTSLNSTNYADLLRFCESYGEGANATGSHTNNKGNNNVNKIISILLTDINDPFYVYELTINDEDYSNFRKSLELLIDFSHFPFYVTKMLKGIHERQSPLQVEFSVTTSNTNTTHSIGNQQSNNNNKGTLRIVELTNFKTIEHLSLALVRQGDVGQKNYLAAKYISFYKKYFHLVKKMEEETQKSRATVEQLQLEKDELVAENKKLSNDINMFATNSEKEKLSDIHTMSERYNNEIHAMRNKYEEEIKQLQRSKDQSVQELQATLKAREELLETTQERLTKAEQSVQQQTLLLSSVKEESTALKTELNSIRQTNKELLNFKMETTKMMSENEINYVQVAERLKHLNELNANKEKELQSLREQYNNQDHYIKMLTSQNEKLSLGMAEKESNVEKANYIISNQLNAIKNLKERYKLATDQIKNNNLLLQEKEGSVNRLRDELSQAQEKLSAQLSKINELKLSLSKTEEVKEKLQTELKNNQNALLHLQKSTSINGRHWGLFNGNTTSTTVNQPTSDGPYNFLNQTSLYNAPKYNSVYRPSSTDPLPHSTSNKENGAPVYRHKEESPLVKTEPKLFTGVDVNSQPRHTIKPSYEDAKVVEVVQKGNTPSGTEKSASPLAQRNFFSDENNAYHPSTVAVSSYF